ncbi:MAG: hypothetical protein ACRD5H_13970, partial [Nitrososphaerales archaeon]
MARPLIYEISVQGADRARAEFQSLHQTLEHGGTVSWEEYRSARNRVLQQSRALVTAQKVEHQMWLATHPNIRKATELMGTFSRMTGVAMGVMNTINLAQIAFNQTTGETIGMRNKLSQAERELAIAVRQGSSAEELANLREEAELAKVQLKEFEDQTSKQRMQNLFTFATSIAHLGSSFGSIITRSPEIIGFFRRLGGSIGGVQTGGGSPPPPAGAGTFSRGFPPFGGIGAPIGAGGMCLCSATVAGIGQSVGTKVATGLGQKIAQSARSLVPY